MAVGIAVVQWFMWMTADGHDFIYPEGSYRKDIIEGYLNQVHAQARTRTLTRTRTHSRTPTHANVSRNPSTRKHAPATPHR